ncbi:hypothetical protein KFK14_11350 [Sphingobium phenoxybenzoativorans]|uniref:Uncharacterized protein n=1 Tax=Sphingobium phenoxybenzoativorans TaxID=1592790 RepID=A0A975KAR5_9SPHN|nr:hypothetical protein [Sphingobium phenoxybenzoativorans]QUT07925.1 hypothetical protein KFK14_11350 [Sphingobium phenoxybenzoativorans]
MPPNTPGYTTQSAGYLRAVTPHATDPLPDGVCRGLLIGTGGNVSIVAENDTDPVLLKNLGSGVIYPIKAKAVRISGTTANDIVALY